MNKSNGSDPLAPALRVAAILFVLVGLALMISPRLLSADTSETPLIVRWLGMLIASYGIGVAIAAPSPVKHWPVFLTGFLAAIIIVIFTLPALIGGTISGVIGWSTILLALVWIVPIGALLLKIAESPPGDTAPAPVADNLGLDKYRIQDGRTLEELSGESPVLLVLLRHLGCTFCRETLADIAAQRREIEATGARIVFVHMGEDEDTRYLFERYRIDDIPRISDPDAGLYRALGLDRASLFQVYGPSMWRYAVQSILLDGHGMGQIVGDRFQMPGTFLIHRGSVISGFRHARISDHPDYVSIVGCLVQSEEIQY